MNKLFSLFEFSLKGLKPRRIFMIIFLFCGLFLRAQMLTQIVFQCDTGAATGLWSVLAIPGAVPVELTPLIDSHALYAGNHYGPVNVSHSGTWYTFQSERFDPDCNGWHCLTLADSAFSSIISVRHGNNNVIHNEGVAMSDNYGKALVYASDEGNHSRDIFIIHRIGSVWTAPKILTANSPYAYNINPRLSYVQTKVIFQAQDTPFPGEAVMTVDTGGSNLSVKISREDTVSGINGCSELCMPGYMPDGSIVFEGHWGGERIWYFPFAASAPVLPSPADGNDNSPVGLPDGRFASLQMPNSTHDLKVQNTDGSGKYFLTGAGTAFDYDIYDSGLGSGYFNPLVAGIKKEPATMPCIIYPNPSQGRFKLVFPEFKASDCIIARIFTPQGFLVAAIRLSSFISTIDITGVAPGFYQVGVYKNNQCLTTHKLLIH